MYIIEGKAKEGHFVNAHGGEVDEIIEHIESIKGKLTYYKVRDLETKKLLYTISVKQKKKNHWSKLAVFIFSLTSLSCIVFSVTG